MSLMIAAIKLKRKLLDPKLLKIDPAQIIQSTSSVPAFEDYLPWIQGNAHGFMHSFVGCSMQITSYAGDEPMFYMHHGNVDRLFHFWADCHEYDKVDPNSLTPTQYKSIFPTRTHPDSVKNEAGIDPNLEYRIPLYYSSTGQFIYCPTTDLPTVRDMWTMGTSDKKGWKGLYYRYGPDPLVPFYDSLGASSKNCKAGNTWTWVNYSQNKKRSGYTEEMGSPEEIELYQNLTMKFNEKVLKNGMTPDEALYDLAMETCKTNPQIPLSEEELRDLVMMGADLSKSKRICDEEISKEEIEVAMSF